jgi:hypothetical protein
LAGLLRLCACRGCETLTLGTFCVEHEQPVSMRSWPKGRPFPDYIRGLEIAEQAIAHAPDVVDELDAGRVGA